ncbi:hypothetical protein GF357_00585 [Candidatus Dojkabacteria bacterium]|nr:hypothetical protein [Candidatus Dojkabacteria bacterium]
MSHNIHCNKRLIFLSLLVILTLVFSCRKEEDSQLQTQIHFSGTSFWECSLMEINEDTTMHFYLFSISQDGKVLSGDVYVRDSLTPEEGIIQGKVKEDSVFFTAYFPDDEYNFYFNGILEDIDNETYLGGNLKSELLSGSPEEEMQVLISPSLEFNCPDFFPTNPYVFRKVNSSGHPGDSAVIFIHGMTGDLTHWDNVLAQLSDDFRKKYDVYLFQYNWKDSININGKILLDSITEAGLSNPIIIAHSMGGLVARAYIANEGETALLVTLGTPHLGSPLAKMANIICFMNYPGSQDLRPDGNFIQKLLTNEYDIQNREKYVVYGGQMKGKFKIVKFKIKWIWAEDYYNIVDKVGYDAFIFFGSPANDGLVPITSAFFEGYDILERKPLLEWVDHKNLRNPDIATEVMDYINSL